MTLITDAEEDEGPIEILIDCPAWEEALPGTAARTRRAAFTVLEFAGAATLPIISFLLTDDNGIRRLNKEWRQQDKPTNVLSFPSLDLKPGEMPAVESGSAPPLLGDVALAYETIAAEAGVAGIPIGNHFDHLVIHGVLHLLGYDHQSDKDADVMEGLETRILARLGVPNPYQ